MTAAGNHHFSRKMHPAGINKYSTYALNHPQRSCAAGTMEWLIPPGALVILPLLSTATLLAHVYLARLFSVASHIPQTPDPPTTSRLPKLLVLGPPNDPFDNPDIQQLTPRCHTFVSWRLAT